MYQDSFYALCKEELEMEDDNDDALIDDAFFFDQDESDEDTEEASETDMAKPGETSELRDQVYRDKLSSLKKQMHQLKDGTHVEYNKKVKRLETQYKERLRLNIIYKDYMTECVERDYIIDRKTAVKEFEEKKSELKENLLADLEEKRKHIESDRYSMELTGDSMEIKPIMTRKLRRRPNDPVPEKVEKRRKAPPAHVNYLLDDKEIESDLKAISRTKSIPAVRKPVVMPHYSPNLPSQQHNEAPLVETRIEDGKLLYERRWFHRGQPVFVDGKDMLKFPAIISAIGTEAIWVKRITDASKVRIFISQLSRGKMSIKRRAS